MLTKGKGPLTVFPYAVVAARLGGAPSAAVLLPLPATNGAKQPVSGKLFPCQARARRAPGSGFPRTLLAPAPGWGKLGLRKRQLSGFRSNFHPHPGGNRGGQRGGSGAGTSAPGSRRGRRARGQAAAAAGRRERAREGGSSGSHFLRHISDI